MTASDIDSDEKIAGRTRTRTEQLGHGIGDNALLCEYRIVCVCCFPGLTFTVIFIFMRLCILSSSIELSAPSAVSLCLFLPWCLSLP